MELLELAYWTSDTALGLTILHKCQLNKNTICGPLNGYFCSGKARDGGCDQGQKYTVCRAGQSVKSQGTAESDTKCEGCPEGTFSTKDMSLNCTPWTDCALNGKVKHTEGSSTADVQCQEKTPVGLIVGLIVVLLCVSLGAGVFIYLKNKVLGLFVRHQCSRVKNTVCSCLKEFFCLDGDGESCRLCRKRRVCQPGRRVKMQGTENSDTVCEDCPRGTFSIHERSLSCTPWTVCKSGGKNGNSTADVVCEEEATTPWIAIAVAGGGALLLFGLLIGILLTVKKTKLLLLICCANCLPGDHRDNQPQNFSSGRVRSPPLPGWASNPWLERTTNSVGVRAGAGGGAGLGVGVGLALFGVSTGSRALCHSLVVENGCQLLYIVEDQRWELEGVFSQEHLTHTRVLRSLHTDIVLRDQCVSGVVVCSPPDEASVIILDALRAGKGVLCEKLPSLNRHIAESCFDEASRCGKPLVCGFFKRFDPALQFLYKRVHENETVGRIQRISTVSRMYPPPSVAAIKSSGGIFYNTAVHDIDVICWLLGESAPDTIFSLGHAFCREMAAVKEPDSISVSMKFPSGAIASLDTSQHCNKSCDQRLEVRRESPFFTREQYLWTIQVAAAAEQSWRNGSAVDLRNEALDTTIIKTEVQ
ncbi:UNVERIFIED_CONTAM: hypothetical protein FKN15_000508 [Acipenser sinensis]